MRCLKIIVHGRNYAMSDITNLMFKRLLRLGTKYNENESDWLKAQRHAAFHKVSECEFPPAKNDGWKYTSIDPLLSIPFELSESNQNHQLSKTSLDQIAGDFGGARLIFLNGHFVPALSSMQKFTQGIKIRSLGAALAEKDTFLKAFLAQSLENHLHVFTALNAAYIKDGAFIQIPANTVIKEPIHLVFLSEANKKPLISHPRSLIFLEANSQITLVETYTSVQDGTYLTNAVTEIVLAEGAVLNHYKVQNEAETAFHFALLEVMQGRNSYFTTNSIMLGSQLARHEVTTKFQDQGAMSTLNGLYLPRNKQHLDNSITVEHNAPHCTSRQLYKGIIREEGHGVFNGRVKVSPGAYKTDASLTNKNLLLSELAQVDTLPQLEIYADDVKCTHGTTIGHLNEEALFYLRSRGIPERVAKDLMTQAFMSEILNSIELEPFRLHLEKIIASQLSLNNEILAA